MSKGFELLGKPAGWAREGAELNIPFPDAFIK